MADTPKSYKDPLYAELAANTEKQLGLPAGMLASVITHGERSNADQVSEAGARTVAQIIPATRAAALKKYGIDAYLSPQNALEVAGRLLKESLDRNQGDPAAAVAEYHGGTDRDNWGPRTRAYVGRVTSGMRQAADGALGADFAAWMATNPAVPEKPAAAPAPADKLGADFKAWLGGGAEIPGQTPETLALSGGPAKPQAPQQEPGLLDQIIGAGEAALSGITGATGGALGAAGGLIAGVGSQVLSGDFSPEAGRRTDQLMAEGANALTFQPRTAVGQERTEQLGQFMQQVLPVAAVAPAIVPPGVAAPARAAAADATRAATATASRAARAVPGAVADAARSTRDAVVQRLPESMRPADLPRSEPTPGTMGSAGAAGTDVAIMRRADAGDLPVPIDLTKGQAERSFEWQRFERETAKDPERGAPLRDRYAEQNHQILQNFDAFIDSTGAEAPTLRAVGTVVDKALVEQAARDKAQVRVAYKNAEKAGELEAPVTLQRLVEHLNDSAPDAATAPLLDVARRRALQLGLAAEDANGQLAAQPVPLKIAETYRQAINRATDYEATNVRQSAIIKQLVDEATDGMGGDLYRQARALRARYATNYENRATIAKLLGTKRGTTDRQVAFEDVFKHSVLDGSLDDVRNVRRVLHRAGDQGQQAWRELQGATLNYVKEQATRNVARDTRGNPIVSADALNKAVRNLDADGKLDFVFGKRGAQQLRTINDVANHVLTAPPGAVNTSNTASVLLAAMDMAISAGGGMPMPVLSGLRILSKSIKDRRIQAKVNEALGHAEKRGTSRPSPAVSHTVH